MTQPGRIEQSKIAVRAAQTANKGRSRPDAAERMRRHNPMTRPEIREKARVRLGPRTFLARGGNGQPTRPQLLLAQALGWSIEFPILTAPIRGQLPSLPPCYKVDLADPGRRLAVEVDGNSHKSKLWRFLDWRKEAALTALGWSVLRFSNKEVLTETERVVAKIMSFTTSR